ncbi:MAG: sulfotransferase [Balneolaceae bacterium]
MIFENFQKAFRLHITDLANLLAPDYGQRDYKKFIILGRSRVGSNMVRGLINARDDLICYGEIFRHRGEVGWDMPFYRHRKLDLFKEAGLLQERPVDFLEQKVFQRYPESVKAVGFKIFYYHALDSQWKDVWKYLKASNFQIIHLKRRNLLSVVLSKKLAEMSGNWKGKSYGEIQLSLDPDFCREEFLKTEQWWKTYDEFFKPNNCLEVWYEDLTTDLEREAGRIFGFLEGVPGGRPIQPTTRKQRKAGPGQQIKNYEELENYFTGTRWEDFFTGS